LLDSEYESATSPGKVSPDSHKAPSVTARLAALPIPPDFHRFLAVGVGGLIVDQASLFGLEQAGIGFLVARALAILVATFVTWVLNRRFTFGKSGRAAHHEALRYFGVALAAQSVNYAVSVVVHTLQPKLPHALAAFVGAISATVFSYSGQRFFTFRARAR
jgi:putative flippase GtrA